ncbi:MAG TPA: hypothetical protein VIY47_02385, partial [Ignavibacteriaceae bacterium]
GVDSEIILRVYKDLGIPIDIYIFRYENGLNIREFNHAINVCLLLGVDYTIIDFNLQKFFENDAYDFWKKVYCGTSGRLPHMKFAEYVDEIPIFGSGEPYWIRKDNGSWVFEFDEDARSWALYYQTINRSVICDWYEYNPEIILSYMNTSGMIDLLNDQVPGKLSTNSSKSVFHKELWPDIHVRPKLVGFEGVMMPGKKSKPDFMLAFEKEFIDGKIFPKKFYYTQDEIVNFL